MKIESGIAIPYKAPGRKQATGLSAALRGLLKGQSVLLPTSLATANVLASRVIGSGSFVCRTMATGVRVWRI